MKNLTFSRDAGNQFYTELHRRVNSYFVEQGIAKSGNNLMLFKIFLYFSLDILFYYLMITSNTLFEFYLYYLLMGVTVIGTAFNISHDACHGIAVKSKFWNKILFSLSFNLQGNNAYVWGKNHNESHHLYTNIEGSDIDVLNNPLFRMTESQQIEIAESVVVEAPTYREGNPIWGILSLSFSILSILLIPNVLIMSIISLLGVIFGSIGFNKKLKDLAITGFILSLISLLISLVIIVVIVLFGGAGG